MKPARIAFQTHRFRDSVGIYLASHVAPQFNSNNKAERKGLTVYLTPRDARKLARAINATARHCKQYPKFSESPPSTRAGDFDGEA